MLRLIPTDHSLVQWVAENLVPGNIVHSAYCSFGVVDEDDTLKGGVVLHDYNHANIEISIYGPGCLKRHIVRQVYTFVFEELRVYRMSARTKRGNKLMCRLLPKLGFDYEATLKNFFGPSKQDDAIMFRLTHEFASRWM